MRAQDLVNWCLYQDENRNKETPLRMQHGWQIGVLCYCKYMLWIYRV